MKQFLIAVPLAFLLSLYGSAQVFSAPNQPTDPAERAAQNKKIAKEIEALNRDHAAHPGAKIDFSDSPVLPSVYAAQQGGEEQDSRKLERDTYGVKDSGKETHNEERLNEAYHISDPPKTAPSPKPDSNKNDKPDKNGGGVGTGDKGSNNSGGNDTGRDTGSKGGGRRD
jgi:hypothetical protein